MFVICCSFDRKVSLLKSMTTGRHTDAVQSDTYKLLCYSQVTYMYKGHMESNEYSSLLIYTVIREKNGIHVNVRIWAFGGTKF